eukprot:8581565-Pyramimonas_sp.AAC.1
MRCRAVRTRVAGGCSHQCERGVFTQMPSLSCYVKQIFYHSSSAEPVLSRILLNPSWPLWIVFKARFSAVWAFLIWMLSTSLGWLHCVLEET